MYSINVLIETYNQQDCIGRALDSILIQKDYGLNKIIVRDDCSKDNNWEVIKEYVKKYPTIIKAYRNEHNLGIYGNVQKSDENRGEADLYFHVAGDDTICNGWFKTVQEYLKSHGVDKNSAYLIQSDYKKIFSDGTEQIISQEIINKKRPDNVMKMLRRLLDNRSVMWSKELMKRFDSMVLDKGLNLTEFLYAAQGYMHADSVYYIPCVGSVYFHSLGVSVSLGNGKEKYDRYWIDENIVKWSYFRDNILKRSVDQNYANYNIYKCKYEKKGGVCALIIACWYRLKGIDRGVDSFKSVVKDYKILFKVHKQYVNKFKEGKPNKK